MPNRRILLTVLGGILLTACTAQGATERHLVCENGSSISVRWLDDSAIVTEEVARWKLPRAMSSSGARYSDGKSELWEHQGEFRWTMAGAAPTICRNAE